MVLDKLNGSTLQIKPSAGIAFVNDLVMVVNKKLKIGLLAVSLMISVSAEP